MAELQKNIDYYEETIIHKVYKRDLLEHKAQVQRLLDEINAKLAKLNPK